MKTTLSQPARQAGTPPVAARQTRNAAPRSSAPRAPLPPAVFNLARPDDVLAAQSACGPIAWISCEPPRNLLGALAEEVQGAWIENGAARLQWGGSAPRRIPLPPGLNRRAQERFLARLLAGAVTPAA